MAGRPKAKIDWNQVGELLEAGATIEGIAATIGVYRETLYKRCLTDNKCDFSTYSQQRKAKGNEMLRTVQFNTAMAGNVTMQIWLGKQRLGQSDKQEVAHSSKVSEVAQEVVKTLVEQGWTETEARTFITQKYPEVSRANN